MDESRRMMADSILAFALRPYGPEWRTQKITPVDRLKHLFTHLLKNSNRSSPLILAVLGCLALLLEVLEEGVEEVEAFVFVGGLGAGGGGEEDDGFRPVPTGYPQAAPFVVLRRTTTF